MQVSRLGLPLINEAVIGLQDKDKYNRTQPANDVPNFGAYFLNPVIVRDAEAVGIYTALGVPQSTRRRAQVEPPRHHRHDQPQGLGPQHPAHRDRRRAPRRPGARLGFPNGRSLEGGPAPNKEQADVTDVLSRVLLSKGTIAVKDNVDYNDRPFLTEFPYLALPWEGYAQGHGKPTP